MTKAQLLTKVRELIAYFHSCGEQVGFADIGELAQRILDASVHIFSREGGLFDTGAHAGRCGLSDTGVVSSLIGEFNKVNHTRVFISENGECPFKAGNCNFEHRLHVVTPLFYGGKRVGTLIYTKDTGVYDELDIALAELIAMLAAQALYNDVLNREKKMGRQKAEIRQAAQSLSYTERRAAEAVIRAALAEDGVINVSRVAAQENITRSVVAGAIRKLESAGIIRVRSLGMKGSYIIVVNPYALEEFSSESF